MSRQQPTKERMIAALRKVAGDSPDGCVSLRLIKDETGWDPYWFDKHWPAGGYQAACAEAGVRRRAIIGVETSVRVDDREIATRFVDAVESIGRVSNAQALPCSRRMSGDTILRGGKYTDAKRRIIAAYFELPVQQRKGQDIDRVLRDELRKLDSREACATPLNPVAASRHSIEVPPDYVSLVREFRERGEEEKRELVTQFFHSVLGYKRARVRSEHKHNDVRVNDRRDEPWLVVEVKGKLEAERENAPAAARV